MKVNGIGCSLVDNLYSPVDFSSPGYRKWTSEEREGVGLITGGLIFGDELQKESGIDYQAILREVVGDGIVPEKNIGGPCIVALIHMAQILYNENVRIAFFGGRSGDENGKYLVQRLGSFNIDISSYRSFQGGTPFTDVLSCPAYNNSEGERSFINYLGAAARMGEEDLSSDFFDADILIYGGTALTPKIHDALGSLLSRGKKSGALNFINTVYDFRNQNASPDMPWPLVGTDDQFAMIDLIITDKEEALRLSGRQTKEEALSFFTDRGVGAVLITHGSEEIQCYSSGTLFREAGAFCMPVSSRAANEIQNLPVNANADTTGCGDNFAGGVYGSVISQLCGDEKEKPSLSSAVSWGVVSGGFAGLYQGGVFEERINGEKLERLNSYLDVYLIQLKEFYE